MKIAKVIHAFYPQRVGGSVFYVKQISEKQKDKYDIHIYTYNLRDGFKYRDYGYKVYYLNGVNFHLPPNVNEWPILFQLQKHLDKFKPDIIEAHSHLFFPSFQAIRYAYENGIPSILFIHGFMKVCDWLTNSLQKLYLYTMCRKLFNMANIIVTLNPLDTIDVLRILGKREVIPHIVLLPPFVDTEYFRPNPKVEKKYDIVWVGRMSQEKDLFTLLYALKGTKLKALLVGDGPEFPRIYRFVKENNLDVTFTGFVPHREVVKYLWQGKIFVYPSIREGAPLAILEAMSCGLPVVVSNIIAHRYLVGGKAHYFEPRNPTYLRKSLLLAKSLLEDNLLEHNFREFVVKNYSIDKVLEYFDHLYELADIIY